MSDDTLQADRVCVMGLVRGPVYVIEYDCHKLANEVISHLYDELKDAGISFVLTPTSDGRSIHIHEPQQVVAK